MDWSKQVLCLPCFKPSFPIPPGLSGRRGPNGTSKYEKTEEGRARVRDARNYPLDVQADGSFTVEDVPPGDYEVSGQLSDARFDLSMRVMGHTIGSFRQDVTVPQPADGQSSETIDLGAIPVQSQNP